MVSLEVPLIPEKLGVKAFSEEDARRIEETLQHMNGRLKELIAAVLAIHRTNPDDVRGLRELFREMSIQMGQLDEKGRLSLRLDQAPELVTYAENQITRGQEELISEIIRDTVYLPEGAESVDPEQRQRVLYEMCRRAGIFRPGPRIRTFIWGGHSVPPEEEAFAESVGYWDGLFRMEEITGCGPGIMKTPFKGVLQGYQKQRIRQERSLIGLTEQGILAFETPNDRIDLLVVFPNIEMRMEAFIRASDRGRVHPGGSGTMEEIMTFLGMKLDPRNAGLEYPFDLVERPEGSYMKMLQQFFRTCFVDALDGLLNFRVERAEQYKHYLYESNQRLNAERLWNEDLVMPDDISTPFEVTFESIEALNLSRDQEPHLLVANMRRFFSAMVHLVAKKPEMLDEWGDERPLVHGDRRILQAVDDLIREFNQRNRLRMSGELRDLPYRIE